MGLIASTFFVTCPCGHPIVTVTRHTQCPNCKALIRIDWPVPPPKAHTL